jgi:hypothetical protein
MVNEEILEGLKSATARGESLLQAMMSFYNAGYPKKAIEEAANGLKQQEAGIPITVTPSGQQPAAQSATQPETQPVAQAATPPVVQKQITQGVQKPNQPVLTPQRVSAYAPKKKSNMITIILISSLVLLFGLLIAAFIFREQLTTLFNNLF